MPLQSKYPIWNGFRTIPRGKSQRYRIRRSPSGKWAIFCLIGDDEYYFIPELGSPADKALIAAVDVGHSVGIPPGGTLIVNEYKDVIKTAYFKDRGVTNRYFVGNYPDFQISLNDKPGHRIDNSDSSGLKIGDPWPFPKVGTGYEYRPSQNDILMKLKLAEDVNKIKSQF